MVFSEEQKAAIYYKDGPALVLQVLVLVKLLL